MKFLAPMLFAFIQLACSPEVVHPVSVIGPVGAPGVCCPLLECPSCALQIRRTGGGWAPGVDSCVYSISAPADVELVYSADPYGCLKISTRDQVALVMNPVD